MLRKIMPYAPYIVVIVSLIIAIIMVVALNRQETKPAPKEAAKTSHTKTAGDVATHAEPTYKVRTSPEARPSVTTPTATTHKKTTTKVVATKTTAVVATTTTVRSRPATTQSTTQLANTGPGEVMAVFAVSTAFAAGAHSFFLRRKLQA